jgi:hypothetical protein
MSTQVTTAFSQQFSSTIMMLADQQEARLASGVRIESVTGEKAFYDQIGNVTMNDRSSRHGDTEYTDTPHSRRMVTMVTSDRADLIDDADKIQMLIDPTNAYTQKFANAWAKRKDDHIINAAFAAASTGKDGTVPTAFTAANIIAIDFGGASIGLTIKKLVEAKRILDAGEVDEEDRHIAVGSKQVADLLGETQYISSDFNTLHPLSQGQVVNYMGFTFHRSERLLVSAGTDHRRCPVWQREGMLLAMGMEIKSRVDEMPNKRYSTQVYVEGTAGATRMEEARVVEILCDESP